MKISGKVNRLDFFVFSAQLCITRYLAVVFCSRLYRQYRVRVVLLMRLRSAVIIRLRLAVMIRFRLVVMIRLRALVMIRFRLTSIHKPP